MLNYVLDYVLDSLSFAYDGIIHQFEKNVNRYFENFFWIFGWEVKREVNGVKSGGR